MNKKEYTKEQLAVKELAEINTGIKVGLHSEDCIEYRKTHENCHGCQYEIACSKSIALLLAGFDINPNKRIQEILNTDDMNNIHYDFPDDYPGYEFSEDD